MPSSPLNPTILVIFGITGDLSKRYLLPALYHLCKDDLLPQHFVVIGTSRQKQVLDDFLGQVELCVLEQDNVCDPAVLKQLRSLMKLVQLDPTNGTGYGHLLEHLNTIEAEHGICMNRLYYLSIPPQIYEPIVKNLAEQGLNGSCTHNKALTRLMVEKPFGYDLTSAEELIDYTGRCFTEKQVFRIDHYLAKETVQDILLFRQRNPAYEARWNGTHIKQIEVVSYEHLGIEGRRFYDQIGALRDLIQSHLLQLLALTTMELPDALTSAAIHKNKEALLNSIGPFPADKVGTQTIRGQYDGYRHEVDNPDSVTETFAAIRFTIPTARWQGTNIMLATGKGLSAKQTAITVTFRDGSQVQFQVQPQPGIATSGERATTDFSDVERPIGHAHADAYERVLVDAIRGDRTLFASSDEVLASWRVVQPVLDQWQQNSGDVVTYPQGSSSPSS
ncbi:MAG TPA: glucose-6-phosphate dehydrogenase [Candidatus Saccharimonadales bacterium]|nr:glucose-6-phosphate dehydrogenase [Candidatus Saccharimonadales bacterium]